MTEPAQIQPAEASESDDDLQGVVDLGRDSMYTLPLAMLPLETAALRRMCLKKDSRLQSMVEVFNEETTGSCQIGIEGLPRMFGWPDYSEHPDLVVMRKLAAMPSFDVYSLRVLLRHEGIRVNDNALLKLTAAKNRELASYMSVFTRPLLTQIYQGENIEIGDVDEIYNLFRDPDREQVRHKLEIMAEKLEIGVEDVPQFLEDYGDIFLSLSYYKQCLDQITPMLTRFFDSVQLVRNNPALRTNDTVVEGCAYVENTVRELLEIVRKRFELFERDSKYMWLNISAERFRQVEAMIKRYHASTGGILCGLTVKMEDWEQRFGGVADISPHKLANYFMSDMRQGLGSLLAVQNMLLEAPVQAAPKAFQVTTVD